MTASSFTIGLHSNAMSKQQIDTSLIVSNQENAVRYNARTMKVTNNSYQYNFNVGFDIDLVRYMHSLESFIY